MRKKKSHILRNIIWILIFAILLAIAACAYLFLYKPAHTPAEVTDYETSILINDETKNVLFTGAVLNGKPVGSGSYVVQEPSGSWSFRGFAYSNGLITGSVEDMPIDLQIGDEIFPVHYTGKMTNGAPSGEGTFLGEGWSLTGSVSDTMQNGKEIHGIMDGEAVNAPVLVKVSNKYTTVRFTGTVTRGEIEGDVDLLVKDTLYTFVYNGVEYTGRYSGTIVNGLPNGEGNFTAEGAQSLSYTGRWKDGTFAYAGSLDCNGVTLKPAKGDIAGSYSGQTVDGLPDGKGTFTTREFVYTGEFKDGLFDGKGVCDYADPTVIDLTGTFVRGEFKPTRAELLVSLGTDPACPYTVPEAVQTFIENSSDLFIGGGSKQRCAPFLKAKYDFNEFITNQSAYYQSLTRCKLTFTSVSVEKDCHGYTLTTFTATDPAHHEYKGYAFMQNSQLVTGRTAYVYHYPFAYSAGTGENGTFLTLISCFG